MAIPSSSDSWLRQAGRWRSLALALVVFPLICFCALLLVYVVDVPWIDDIDAFLSFIIGYIDAPTLAQKMDWLIRPNNEHRILTGKLITLLMYKLTGVVSYRWLIFAAFGFLLGLLFLFYRVFRSMNLPLLAFVPVVFLLLQPQYYLTSMWAITGMQHEVVILLVFVALYLLAGEEPGLFWAGLGVQVLASLSMSNGLFGWVAGVVVLTLQRQWTRLGVWLVLGVGTIVFYFHDFPDGQGNESSVSYFLEHPHLIFFGFFTFTGGVFDFVSKAPILWRSVLPTLAGFMLIPAMLWFLWRMNEPRLGRLIGAYTASNSAIKQGWKRRYFFTGCYAFLMVNAVTVAFLRPRFGYEVMLISNYMIYAAVLVVLLYLNGLSEHPTGSLPGRWVAMGLVLGVLVWANWYGVNLPKIAYRKQQLLTYAFNQKHNKTGLGPSWGSPFLDLADRTFTETIRRGIYRFPDAYYTPYEKKLLAGGGVGSDVGLHVDISGGGYSYMAQAGLNALPQPPGPAAVVIQSEKRTYLFPSEVPFAFADFYRNTPAQVIQGEIINPTVAPGLYRVGILDPSNAEKPIRISAQMIAIP